MDYETHHLSIQLQNISICATPVGIFCFFPKLPIEVRFMIWRFHSNYPKTHSFDAVAGKESPLTPNSALLSVNRESRAETMRSLVPLQNYDGGGIKYIDPELDTIRFWGSGGSMTFFADDLIIEHGKWCAGKHRVKRLEIKGVEVIPNSLIELYGRRGAIKRVDGRMLGRHFRGLETITVLSNGWSQMGWQDGVVRSDSFKVKGVLRGFHQAVFHEFMLVKQREFPECKIPQLILDGWPLPEYE